MISLHAMTARLLREETGPLLVSQSQSLSEERLIDQ